MEDFILVFGFDVGLRKIHSFGMEIVQDLQKDVASGEFLERSDEEVLLLELAVIPLQKFLF